MWLHEKQVSVALLRRKFLGELVLTPFMTPRNLGPLLALCLLTFCRLMESCWINAWSSCSFCSRAVILSSAPVFEAVRWSLHWKKADNEQIWISQLRQSSTGKIQMVLCMSGPRTLVKLRLSLEKMPWLSEAEAQREKLHPGLSKKSWSACGSETKTMNCSVGLEGFWA